MNNEEFSGIGLKVGSTSNMQRWLFFFCRWSAKD